MKTINKIIIIAALILMILVSIIILNQPQMNVVVEDIPRTIINIKPNWTK